jgi:hypothetical protein
MRDVGFMAVLPELLQKASRVQQDWLKQSR